MNTLNLGTEQNKIVGNFSTAFSQHVVGSVKTTTERKNGDERKKKIKANLKANKKVAEWKSYVVWPGLRAKMTTVAIRVFELLVEFPENRVTRSTVSESIR